MHNTAVNDFSFYDFVCTLHYVLCSSIYNSMDVIVVYDWNIEDKCTYSIILISPQKDKL